MDLNGVLDLLGDPDTQRLISAVSQVGGGLAAAWAAVKALSWRRGWLALAWVLLLLLRPAAWAYARVFPPPPPPPPRNEALEAVLARLEGPVSLSREADGTTVLQAGPLVALLDQHDLASEVEVGASKINEEVFSRNEVARVFVAVENAVARVRAAEEAERRAKLEEYRRVCQARLLEAARAV